MCNEPLLLQVLFTIINKVKYVYWDKRKSKWILCQFENKGKQHIFFQGSILFSSLYIPSVKATDISCVQEKASFFQFNRLITNKTSCKFEIITICSLPLLFYITNHLPGHIYGEKCAGKCLTSSSLKMRTHSKFNPNY